MTNQNPPIELLPWTFQTDSLYELIKDDTIWNEYKYRTQSELSPHHLASDIYIRYMDPIYFGKLKPTEGFDFIWYTSTEDITNECQKLCYQLMNELPPCYELGGVILTKIPSGKCVKIHNDSGYNALEYDTKFAIQISRH